MATEDNHSGITHVITDRETIHREKTKEYVQPQWVYDSVNFSKLLNVKEYEVGKVKLVLFRNCRPIYLLSLMRTTLRDTCLRGRRS